MILYRITHAAGQLRVTATDDRTHAAPYAITPHQAAALRPSCNIGFACGYLGAGSHALALAILLDALDDEYVALQLFDEFTRAYVVGWPEGQDSEISSDEIETWAGMQLARGGAA